MRKTDDEDEDPSKGRGENITPFYISEEEVQILIYLCQILNISIPPASARIAPEGA